MLPFLSSAFTNVECPLHFVRAIWKHLLWWKSLPDTHISIDLHKEEQWNTQQNGIVMWLYCDALFRWQLCSPSWIRVVQRKRKPFHTPFTIIEVVTTIMKKKIIYNMHWGVGVLIWCPHHKHCCLIDLICYWCWDFENNHIPALASRKKGANIKPASFWTAAFWKASWLVIVLTVGRVT